MLDLGQTVLGRFRIDGKLDDGRALASDDGGARYVLTTVEKAGDLSSQRARRVALPYFGIATLVALESLNEWSDVLVEVQPPGERSDALVPMTPARAAMAMAGLAWVLKGIHAQSGAPLGAIDPSYVWVDGDRVTVMPRAQLLFSANTSSCVGRISPFSPAFLSPEQVSGVSVDVASDRHSLGALAAYWLSGEPAFLGEPLVELLMGILQGRRRPVRRRHALWDLIDGLLAIEPARRLSLDELLERIEGLDLSLPLQREADPATRAELLAAVCAAPDDDAPRLVYADFLSDHGDPRGELIQVQCALERAGSPTLRRREEELLAAHENDFTHHLFPWARAWTWRRGFIARVEVERFGHFADHVAGLRAEGPLPEVLAPGATYSDDGRRVLEMLGSLARVWDAATGEPIALPHHVARRAHFSRDGHDLIVELDGGTTRQIPLPPLT